MQLHAGIRTFVQLLGHTLFRYRELKLVRLNRALHFAVLQTRLDHLALVRLEDKSLLLEVVDITFVNALSVHETELKENESRQHQHCYH